jgi:WD40 repeat protein
MSMKYFHYLTSFFLLFIGSLFMGCTESEVPIHVAELREGFIVGGNRDIPGGASFTPEGDKVVLPGNNGIVQIVNWESWEVVRTLAGHTDHVHSARFSPDGEKIITASDDGTLRIFEVDSGAELRKFEHAGGVIFASFSPDEKHIITGDKDGTVRLWETDMEAELQKFEGHTGAVPSIVFSPDGTKIATSSDDGTARLWDLALGTELDRLEGLLGDHVSQFLPDGTGVLLLGVDDAFVWEFVEGFQR